MTAFELTFIHVVGGCQPEEQAKFLRARFEQGRLVTAAGNAAEVFAVFHGGRHDPLDEDHLSENLLDGERGGFG